MPTQGTRQHTACRYRTSVLEAHSKRAKRYNIEYGYLKRKQNNFVHAPCAQAPIPSLFQPQPISTRITARNLRREPSLMVRRQYCRFSSQPLYNLDKHTPARVPDRCRKRTTCEKPRAKREGKRKTYAATTAAAPCRPRTHTAAPRSSCSCRRRRRRSAQARRCGPAPAGPGPACTACGNGRDGSALSRFAEPALAARRKRPCCRRRRFLPSAVSRARDDVLVTVRDWNCGTRWRGKRKRREVER